MTEELYEKMKEEYFNSITKLFYTDGNIMPHIVVFGDEKDTARPAVVHIPLINEDLSDSDAKDHFIENRVPELSKTVQKRFVVKSVGWVSEGWMTVVQKKPDFESNKKNSFKKMEVLIINIESAEGDEVHIFEIKRYGPYISAESVDDKGKLHEKVELVGIPELEEAINKDLKEGIQRVGRFQGLYEKFIKDQD